MTPAFSPDNGSVLAFDGPFIGASPMQKQTSRLLSVSVLISGIALVMVTAYLNGTAAVETEGSWSSPFVLLVVGIAVASIPATLAIQSAVTERRYALAIIMLLGISAGEIWGFAQTVDRTLVARDHRVLKIDHGNSPYHLAKAGVARAVADLDSAKAKADEAALNKKCGDTCLYFKEEEKQARQRLVAAESTLAAAPAPKSSARWTEVVKASADVGDLINALAASVSSLLFGLGFVAFGHRAFEPRVAPSTPESPDGPDLHRVSPDDLILMRAYKVFYDKHERHPSVGEIADVMRVGSGEASKRLDHSEYFERVVDPNDARGRIVRPIRRIGYGGHLTVVPGGKAA